MLGRSKDSEAQTEFDEKQDFSARAIESSHGGRYTLSPFPGDISIPFLLARFNTDRVPRPTAARLVLNKCCRAEKKGMYAWY